MEDIKLKKQYLRKKYREIRDNIPEKQRKRKSREICRNLFADADISKNKIISLYAPIKSEVDISLLIELYLEEGNIITLPRIDEYEKTLDFKRYKIGVELIKSKKYGIFEPSENYESFIPDYIILPMLAFDYARNRLGYGGGFYDRTIEKLRSIKPEIITIGVAFKEQQESYIPTDQYDITLDCIVTDDRIII